MTAKERAIELIKTISDEQAAYVINFIKNIEEKHAIDGRDDDGTIEYLFRNYVDDHIREPLVDFGEAVGNEKW
jgi:hypothetical protein